MVNKKILIIDDDTAWCVRLKIKFAKIGFLVDCESDGEQALKRIKSTKYDAILLDILFGNVPKGKDIFKNIKVLDSSIPVIPLTSTVRSSFNLEDYPGCAFPFDKAGLNSGTDEVYKKFGDDIKAEIEKSHIQFAFVVGKTEAMINVCEDVRKVAQNDTTVLITGESGTGKEHVARAIHFTGNRKDQKFVAINCATLSENLLESELFGYVKGAFTGAINDKKGLFEEADGGTMFMDEIGDIPKSVQAKILRVLQEGEFISLGDTVTKKVDVRIIAATNQDLLQRVQEKEFRKDLYYRLNVINIKMPLLRDRKEDIPKLLEFIIEKFNKKLNKGILTKNERGELDFRHDMLRKLTEYDWPGNIREFENAVERAMTVAGGSNVLLPEHFEINFNKEKDKTIDIDVNINKVVEEVFEKKWNGEERWKLFLKKYNKENGLKQIIEKCIDRLKNELKRNITAEDLANLFGITSENAGQVIYKKGLGINWKILKYYNSKHTEA